MQEKKDFVTKFVNISVINQVIYIGSVEKKNLARKVKLVSGETN